MKKKEQKYYTALIRDLELDRVDEQVWNSPEFRTMLEKEWDEAGSGKGDSSFRKEQVLERLMEQVGSGTVSSGTVSSSKDHSPKTKSRTIRFFRKYAAILVIGLVLGSGALYIGVIGPGLSSGGELTEITGTAGSVSSYTLPDGSTVDLNESSSLQFPERFGRRHRRVTLSGEAMFSVARDEGKPFYVETRDVTIEVLGTRFNVKSYPESDLTETILLSGKLRINREDPNTGEIQRVVLTPGHQATFFREEERFIMDRVGGADAVAWLSGSVKFDNERFSAVIKKLERKYDLEITLEDEQLAKARISLQIDEEPAEEVLIIVSKTLSLGYTRDGNQVTFFREGKKPDQKQPNDR